MPSVSVIIPAYDEEERLPRTLQSIVNNGDWFEEIIVVDDGSHDQTSAVARRWTKHVCRHAKNQGKAQAMLTGAQHASSSILVFLDADLEQTAQEASQLIVPIVNDEADMTVGVLPATKHGGFGLVKNWAAWSIYRKTGRWLQAPLSGQRAIRKETFLNCYRGDRGFGVEVGLTLDCLKADCRIREIDIAFSHRVTGRTLSGFKHRFKQGLAVFKALRAR